MNCNAEWTDWQHGVSTWTAGGDAEANFGMRKKCEFLCVMTVVQVLLWAGSNTASEAKWNYLVTPQRNVQTRLNESRLVWWGLWALRDEKQTMISDWCWSVLRSWGTGMHQTRLICLQTGSSVLVVRVAASVWHDCLCESARKDRSFLTTFLKTFIFGYVHMLCRETCNLNKTRVLRSEFSRLSAAVSFFLSPNGRRL